MNLRGIDLNLLVVLEALLEERHVTRAARRLALSQPAASNALERCRRLFDDALLERVAGEMRLTAKAEALREPLARALSAVAHVVDAPQMELGAIQQTVRVVMADQPGNLVMTGLLPRLRETAPNVDVMMLPWRGGEDALQRLEGGEVDLALSVFPTLPPGFHRVDLEVQHYVVAMRVDHPAARRFTLEKWLKWPHVIVSADGSKRGVLDEVLAEHGRDRRVGAVVPGFLMVEPLLVASDLIGLIPASCLSPEKHLAVYEPPVKVPDFTLHLAWHARRDGDPVVRHVMGLVREIFAARKAVKTRRK